MNKVEPKLTFQVGEEVVICGQQIGLFTCDYPDKNNFCFTTIKEVKDDGTVIVEEGYRYRQSYKTEYGYTDVHDYFRIFRCPKSDFTHFNGTEYRDSGNGHDCNIRDTACFIGLTFLFKMTDDFKLRVIDIQRKYAEKLLVDQKRHEEFEKKQVFIKQYEEEFKELEELLAQKKAESFRKHICGNCKHNHAGYCSKWNRDIDTAGCSMCSAFEVK